MLQSRGGSCRGLHEVTHPHQVVHGRSEGEQPATHPVPRHARIDLRRDERVGASVLSINYVIESTADQESNTLPLSDSQLVTVRHTQLPHGNHSVAYL